MTSTPSLRLSRIQVRSFDTTATGVQAVADVVRTRLSRWVATTTGVEVQDSLLANEFDFEETGFGPDNLVYGVQQDYRIWHLEAS